MSIAVISKRLDVVQMLLDAGYSASGIKKEDPFGEVCYAGDDDMAELLIKHKAQPCDRSGPIISAARNGKYRIVEYIFATSFRRDTPKRRRALFHSIKAATVPSYMGNLDRPNTAVIDLIYAQESFSQQRWQSIFDAVFFNAIEQKCFRNAIHLYNIHVRRYTDRGVGIHSVAGIAEIAERAARHDELLPITKNICESSPSADIFLEIWAENEGVQYWAEREGWGAKEGLLYCATNACGHRNPNTIQYLLDVGSKITFPHMKNTIEWHGSTLRLDKIFARDHGFPQHRVCAHLQPLHYALEREYWASSFRLIHYGEKYDPKCYEVTWTLWLNSIAFFVTLDSVDSKLGWTQDHLLDFTDDMMAKHPRPDYEVFGTVQPHGSEAFLRQMWTMLHHLLGDNFITTSRRLVSEFETGRGKLTKGTKTWKEFEDLLHRMILGRSISFISMYRK